LCGTLRAAMTIRLYVDSPLAAGLTLVLPPGPSRHAQVRRVQPGDGLVLFDGHGGEWLAAVLSMGRNEVKVAVTQHLAVDREAPLAVTLAVGMPANDRMDGLVEKATELGVAAIQPLLCERSVLRLDGERAQRKREHWQGVAAAASEQCGRTRLPRVAPVLTLAAWLDQLGAPVAGGPSRWLLSPTAVAGRPALPAHSGSGSGRPRLLALSGPEGGLSAAEQTAALALGFNAVSLGPRVLRADTAPLALLAWAAVAHGAGATIDAHSFDGS
jgi:16S rRNA (uracil1498-N3)-methyltransferase